MDVAVAFHCTLLQALGLTYDPSEGHVWDILRFESGSAFAQGSGTTADPDHQPNTNRIAFSVGEWEQLARIDAIVREARGRNVEGPCARPPPPEEATDQAMFFEDPGGSRLDA